MTRDAEDYICSVHCAYNIIVIVSFATTKSRNPRSSLHMRIEGSVG